MTLAESKVGHTYTVTDIRLEENIERRLEALGLTYGTKIELLNQKRSKTSVFKVRGTRLAVGREIAYGITVEGEGDPV